MELALKVLDSPTMIAISAAWLAEGGLGVIPEASGLVPRVQATHDALVAAKPATTPEQSAELVAVLQAQQAADGAHDAALRAFMHLAAASRYWALALEPPNDARAAALATLIASLIPGGANTANQTYAAEAEAADAAAARLEADVDGKSMLGTIDISPSVTALDVFDRYVTKGRKLGELDDRKRSLEAKASDDPSATLKARNAWIKLGAAVAAVLEHADGEPAEALLQTLVGECDKARTRALRAMRPSLPPPSVS